MALFLKRKSVELFNEISKFVGQTVDQLSALNQGDSGKVETVDNGGDGDGDGIFVGTTQRLWNVAVPAFLVIVAASVMFGLLAFYRKMLSGPKAPTGCHLPKTYYPGLIPVLGSFISFAKDPLGTIWKGREKCGNVFTMNLLVERVTFMIGPKAHEAFFSATDEELDQAAVYRFMTPIFGKGVVYDAPLKIRRQQIRGLGESLKPGNLKKYPEIIAREAADYFAKKWGDEGTVDIHKAMADLIIMTASSTLMGPEIRHEMFDEMHVLYHQLDQGLTPLSAFFPYAPTAAHKKRDEARVQISKLFSRLIEKRRTDPESNNHSDLVQRLMNFRYKDGTALTDDEITGMMVATLFAGQHTSNVTATWTILFLLEDARNGGKLLDRAVQELSEVEPEVGDFAAARNFDAKVLNEEEFLYGCVREAIRMYPPIILLMRRVLKPLTLEDGTYVPEGDRVMVSNAVAQRLPEIFTNPNTYDPDRWTSFDISKLPKYSFIGFGAGLHTCLGEPFAFMQVRTILSVLLSTYDLELVTEFPSPDYESIVVMPHGPNMVRYRKRKPLQGAALDALKKEKTLRRATREAETSEKANKKAAAAKLAAQGGADDVIKGVRMITPEEVSLHNERDDLWIIVEGKVYDVTNFVDIHQGGAQKLLNVAGKDATVQFNGPQHPASAPQLLARYYIGDVCKGFKKSEVAKHNKRDDLWIIVRNKVYDVTSYVDTHQGGDNALIKVAGTDATDKVEGPQHPSNVKDVLNQFFVGKIVSG